MRTIFPLGAEGLGDAELISAVRAGDDDAYDELSRRHSDAARRLARLLVPTDDVDDLVSEAFAKVRLVLQHGDGPDLAFRPYLLTAVRRLHVDHVSAATQSVEGPEDVAAAKAFTSLAEPWRMVLWHTEVEGEGPDEVAALLGESPDSVPALVSRAREGMRIAWLTMHEPTADKDCEWTRHNLGAYVRKVSFDRDTARVERHLEGCERCSAIHVELTEGSADLRDILAPLVLGGAATAYLGSTDGPKPRPRAAIRAGARARAGAGAAVAGVAAIFGRAGSAAAGAASATTSASAAATGRVGDQLARAKDFVTDRTAATAVAGVAAVAVIAAGTFIAVQTADGPLEASAEAPLGVVLDDDSTAAGDTEGAEETEDTTNPSSIGSAASAARSDAPSDDPSDSESASPSDDPTEETSGGASDDPSQDPTDPGPGRPSQQPSQQPTRPPSQHPSQQPTRPPTQQPTQPPTQQPTQPPTQAPTPPSDMSISASSGNLLGLVYSINVRVTGLTPGGSATLVVRSSGGSATGLSMDGRCSRVAGGGATCSVTSTPASFRFRANALSGRPNTVTFTVYPDGDSDANTGDNSTSVTLRS